MYAKLEIVIIQRRDYVVTGGPQITNSFSCSIK